MIYIGIILTVIALGILLIAFFVFATWRALLGKSSVDLKLATSVDIQTKKLEGFNKSMDKYNATNSSMGTELKDIKRYLKDIVNS